MNPANWLTLIRIFCIPLIIILLPRAPWSQRMLIWTAIILTIVLVTDYLDGWIARKFNLVTNLGKLLDPLADKMLVLSVYVYYVHTGLLPYAVVIIVLFREFAVMGLRMIASLEQNAIKADMWGKVKTVSQFFLIFWILFSLPHLLIVTWIMVILTIISGVNYFIRNWRVLAHG